jgi:hypothetical protein
MNFVELRAFSKVDPDRAKLKVRTFKVRAGAHFRTPALLLALIHLSAWKERSRKFVCRTLHEIARSGAKDEPVLLSDA